MAILASWRENGAFHETGGLAVVAQETVIFSGFLPSSGREDLDSREQASSDAKQQMARNRIFPSSWSMPRAGGHCHEAARHPQVGRSVNLLQESHECTMCGTSTDVSMGG